MISSRWKRERIPLLANLLRDCFFENVRDFSRELILCRKLSWYMRISLLFVLHAKEIRNCIAKMIFVCIYPNVYIAIN